MSEPVQTTAVEEVMVRDQAVERAAIPRQQPTTISDPRQVAAVVMAQMNMLNTRKDELTIAMKGLTDLTQQLVRAYAGQVQLIEQLASRVKTLEEAAGAAGVS